MDKLHAMKLFCRSVETGSFAAAANSLDVVPSAISKTIAALEQQLGFALMNRSTRGLSLTEEGAAYHEQCRRILAEIEDAETAGRGGGAARGTLRIGLHPALRFRVLTQMGSFLQACPDLAVETVVTNLPSAVVQDGLDLVLHVGRLPDSSLIARPLGSTRSVLCAAPAYLAAHGTPAHPSELAGHPAVIYARRDEEPNTTWVFSRGAERCQVDVAGRAISRDGVGVVDAILGSCGIGRPFAISVSQWIASGHLSVLMPDWDGGSHAISAVLPPHGRQPPAKVQRYLEHTANWLSAPA